MSSISDKILALTKQLYPTGRAFKMPLNGYLEAFHRGLAVSEAQAYQDALAIHNSILPDNANFTADDATDWERRLGMVDGSANTLSVRKLAIQRKLNYPGNTPEKGHYLHLEEQLQSAGFNVYVYENRFPLYPTGYFTKTPEQVTGLSNLKSKVQYGQKNYGLFKYGGYYANKIVNHIEEERDYHFDLGGTLKCTFFIGGNPIGSYANVPTTRKDEFRQLILRIKQVQDVGFLLINYT
ncbi:MAG: hypothetical protein K0S44_215 [Bacteroidetes bacterium]|jgi:hypothetical protein|nr:hypothetical protein [Bacteroidota bacterium]